MGKKRRERREIAGPTWVVEEPAGERMTLAQYRAEIEKLVVVDRTWAVAQSRTSWGGTPRTDGVVISVLVQKAVAQAVECGADPELKPITVQIFNDHGPYGPVTNGAVIDVEDAKALVNALSEAIAYAEGRTR
jgi:hypothetical protein